MENRDKKMSEKGVNETLTLVSTKRKRPPCRVACVNDFSYLLVGGRGFEPPTPAV